ncbi:hypothetical protein M0R45_019000 [Rubus argutus]|uniref:BED-type domain-containing protein n=1 Tax=Rubus argutus TaxID=59490 RepID=A0AAW1X621_RUBAR
MDNTNDANLIDCEGSLILEPPTKTPKFKSPVWAFFEKVRTKEDGQLVTKNKCSICKALLNSGPIAGTSHLKWHLKMYQKAQAETGQMQLGLDATGNLKKYGYNKENARKELVDFIIRAELPFTFVEKYDFKGMIHAGGRVIFEKRAALSPSTIEALICLKDWSSAKSRNQDAVQEELFAEELMNTTSSRPDWMLDIEEEAIIDCEPVNDTSGGNTNMVDVHID